MSTQSGVGSLPSVLDFVRRAQGFRSLVESHGRFEEGRDLRELASAIALLYAASLSLPTVEPRAGSVASDVRPPGGLGLGPVDHYWEVFDPREPSDLVVGSLSDDVGDIYRDVVRGLMLFENGEAEAAVWHWGFSRESHWGDHAVDALRALQRLIPEGDLDRDVLDGCLPAVEVTLEAVGDALEQVVGPFDTFDVEQRIVALADERPLAGVFR